MPQQSATADQEGRPSKAPQPHVSGSDPADQERAASAFREQADAASTLPALRALFGRTVRLFGFSAFAAGLLPQVPVEDDVRPDPFLLLDWPRAWLELYAREGFAKDDFLIAEALTRTEPITWSEFRIARPGASARIFAAAAEFGWLDGMLVPIRKDTGGGRKVGVVSLAAPKPLELDAEQRAHVTAISRCAFARAQWLKGDVRPATSLSEREQKALSLVSRGFSDAEIGRELGISKDTSHLHVERAKRRLGAVTRAQAVAIAFEQGLLTERS